MVEGLPHDLASKVGYRIAYGEAARLAETDAFDHGWGWDFAAAVGAETEAIEREVMRRLGPAISPALIKLAARDVMERRKPRW
jgi:hypothetical protein